MSPVPHAPGGRNQPQWRSTCLDDTAWLSVCLYELETEGGYFEFCACHRYGCVKLEISKVRDYIFNNVYSPHIGLERTAVNTTRLVTEF